MVRINAKTCGGCDRVASYGYPGEKAIYCYCHSVDGTVQLRKKKCTRPSCPRCANYGHGGKATYCRQHASDGMTGPDGKRVSTTASRTPATPATPPEPSAKAPTLAAAVVRGSAVVGRASALFAARFSGKGADGGGRSTLPGDECSTDNGDGNGGADYSTGVDDAGDGVQQPVMEATFICAGARGQTNASNLHVLVAAAATAEGAWESESGGCFYYSGGGSSTGSDDETADNTDQV